MAARANLAGVWVLGVDAAAVVVSLTGLGLVLRGVYRRARSLLRSLGGLTGSGG